MRRLLALLTLALGATLLLAPSAVAGGPTSVLISDPMTGRMAGLSYTVSSYADLDRLVSEGETLDHEPTRVGSRAVTLTWLIHDVQPWRTQQLYLDAPGGPVLVTYGSEAMGDADEVTWSRPADGTALADLVNTTLGGAPANTPTPAVEQVVTERTVTETAWWSLTGWRWLVPGLALGAGLTLLVTGRGRSRDREPRQVLVDVAP